MTVHEPSIEWSTADIARHLRTTSVFRNLDEGLISRIADAATMVLVRAGDPVMIEGDPGDEAFIVIAGRLDVRASTAEGPSTTVGTLGPGDVVGEMALITEEPRSASVHARRDSALMQIPAGEFRTIAFDHPEVLLDVTRTVMRRLDRSIHAHRPEGATKAIAIIPAGADPRHREFAQVFVDSCSGLRVQAMTSERIRADLGADPDRSRVAEYLHRIEDGNDLVILVGDTTDPDWTDLCGRQSDVTLLVGEANGLATVTDPERRDRIDGSHAPSERHLVLVHDGTEPSGTSHLLPLRATTRHHHVRSGSRADAQRVFRIVRDSSVGVVFGGGGARGFAHLGVLKALQEAGVPIDHVGGSSIGSSAASGYAMGWDWDRMLDGAKRVTYERGRIVDLTFPSVALGAGRRLTEGMREAYGDIEIEDLWTEYFCVSTDLTIGDVKVHDRGPLWWAIRASVAIPGLLPPMRTDDGHVLVDGGVLDNLPIATMADRYGPRRIIAVDVGVAASLPSRDLDGTGTISGWRVLGGRLPGIERPEVPGIVETLLAASTVSGRRDTSGADLVIAPDVSGFSMMDFARSDEIVETGYRHAVEILEGWQVDLGS